MGEGKYIRNARNLIDSVRFELIDETGRVYVRYGVGIDMEWQDDGQTLKVFVRPRDDDTPPLYTP